MVDDFLVMKKLASMARYQQQLLEYSTISVEQYRADWKVQRIVERTLQMMIELCADIANHMIADLGLRTPQTYADTFQIQNSFAPAGSCYGENGQISKHRRASV